MTNWENGYFEADRGKFEAVLMKDGREICYTDDGTVQIGHGFQKKDVSTVQEYADYYGYEIQW